VVSPRVTASRSLVRLSANAARPGRALGADRGDPGREFLAAELGEHLAEGADVAGGRTQIGWDAAITFVASRAWLRWHRLHPSSGMRPYGEASDQLSDIKAGIRLRALVSEALRPDKARCDGCADSIRATGNRPFPATVVVRRLA
jgi:hypothetical protein